MDAHEQQAHHDRNFSQALVAVTHFCDDETKVHRNENHITGDEEEIFDLKMLEIGHQVQGGEGCAVAMHTPASRNQRSHSLLMRRKGKKKGRSSHQHVGRGQQEVLGGKRKRTPYLLSGVKGGEILPARRIGIQARTS